MLKKVEFLDRSGNYAYAPTHSEAVINTDEIVKAVALRPENTRSSYPIVKVWFRDGSTLEVIGQPSDLVEISQP